jgi:hypothetical protein
MANKISKRTRTECSTFGTDLGSIVRFNLNHFNSISFSFILDEALQLKETPVANPIVHSLSSPLFTDTFEVFHDYLISIEFGNNVFADVMINPSHVTSFSSANLPKKTLGGKSAFCLKNRTQVFELSFDLLDFAGIIKLAIRSDCQVVYSEVDTKNSILDIRAIDSNLFRECEQEETSAFFINSKQTFTNIPTEIIFITSRNVELELLSAIEQSKNENFSLDVSTSWYLTEVLLIIGLDLAFLTIPQACRIQATAI